MHVLMEGTPRGIDPFQLRKDLEKIPGVVLAHDMHVWSITMGRPALAVHLTIGPMPDIDSEVRPLIPGTRVLHARTRAHVTRTYSFPILHTCGNARVMHSRTRAHAHTH